jgi:hypothetical protein
MAGPPGGLPIELEKEAVMTGYIEIHALCDGCGAWLQSSDIDSDETPSHFLSSEDWHWVEDDEEGWVQLCPGCMADRPQGD